MDRSLAWRDPQPRCSDHFYFILLMEYTRSDQRCFPSGELGEYSIVHVMFYSYYESTTAHLCCYNNPPFLFGASCTGGLLTAQKLQIVSFLFIRSIVTTNARLQEGSCSGLLL